MKNVVQTFMVPTGGILLTGEVFLSGRHVVEIWGFAWKAFKASRFWFITQNRLKTLQHIKVLPKNKNISFQYIIITTHICDYVLI